MIQRIKNEIERLKREELIRNDIGVITGKHYVVDADALLSFIESLEKEQPQGLDEAPKKKLRKVSNWIEEAKYEVEHEEEILEEKLKELRQIRAEKDRLDEAAEEYEKSLDYYHYTGDNPSVAFKAGAKWMEKQGVKDIFDAEVVHNIHGDLLIKSSEPLDANKYKFGDWYKIAVLR